MDESMKHVGAMLVCMWFCHFLVRQISGLDPVEHLSLVMLGGAFIYLLLGVLIH